MARPPILVHVLVAALLLLPGCDRYPRDADGLTDQAARHGMRVGASHDPPWVIVGADGSVGGEEAALLERFARSRGYRVIWQPGAHEALMRELQRSRLHAVIGGHLPDTPWKPEVGWSRPHGLRAGQDGPMPERRIALPPGQSEWQLAMDTWLVEHGNGR